MGLEILGITLFVLLIGASIALHEIGHLVPAKKFGVRVTDYMVGFGPTIWSKVKGETRYGLKAFPVGGYIRMIGMLPPGKEDPDGTARSMNTGRFAAMIAQARQQSLEEVRVGDENRLFYKLPVRKRVIIMLGGPVMNLPAAVAGLEPGDVIVSVGPVASSSWEDITAWIRANPGRSTQVVVERDGGQVSLPLTVADIERPVYDEYGEITEQVEQIGFLGVAPVFEYQSQPVSSVPAYMWNLTYRTAAALLTLPIRIYELVDETLIGGGERSINSPVSVVGASRLGGEIAAMQQPVTAKVATFLGLAASLNLFLFLFNLLPVLPLDGGHIAGALYESVKRFLARVRGKPDPGPVDTARLLPVAYVVAAVLLGVGLVVIWADLVKPITLS